MARNYRVRARGKQRTRMDAALIAQAIIQLGRELAEEEKQQALTRRQDAKSSKTTPDPTTRAEA